MQRQINGLQKRVLSWIIPAFSFGLGSPLLAGDAHQNGGEENPQEEVDGNLELELSSADRIANHTSFQLGVGYRRGLGLELGLDIYRDEDNLFTIKLGRYETKNTDGFTTLGLTHLLAENTFYLGESLFVGIGASLTALQGVDKGNTLITSEGVQAFSFDGTTRQIAFTMSAGNQWQFDHWTFGAHWLNLYLPFYVTSVQTSSQNGEGAFSVRELQRKQDLSSTSWRIDYGASLDVGYNF